MPKKRENRIKVFKLMNEEHIRLLKEKLIELNPLGEKAKLISDLNDYETEAIDILSEIEKRDSRKRVQKIVRTMLEEAFNFDLKEEDCIEITELLMVVKRQFEY
jgi:hypothetical protein